MLLLSACDSEELQPAPLPAPQPEPITCTALPRDAGSPSQDAPDAGSVSPSEPDAGPAAPSPCAAATKVDMLFMVDNSASMSQEQNKLAAVLPGLVRALATGNRDGQPRAAGQPTDFPAVSSLHIGVVTSDLGVNGAEPVKGCGKLSFSPSERDTLRTASLVDKPVGDDGILQIDTDVASTGIFAPAEQSGAVEQVVAPDPSCAGLSFQEGQRFVTYTAGGDVDEAARRFACIAKRGRNGCGFEQQLEATLKALTPVDSALKFTAQSPDGQGDALAGQARAGKNKGFLRDDAVLVLILLSDEEDCSVPDQNARIFDPRDMTVPGEINVRCGLAQNQALLHDPSRYVDGLKALKPAPFRSRIVFAAATGVPLAATAGDAVHSGEVALDALLARPDMQFAVRRNAVNTTDEWVPACESPKKDGSAAPGRRYIQVAKGFGSNGVVSSICEDQYAPLFEALTVKIAAQLKDTSCTR